MKHPKLKRFTVCKLMGHKWVKTGYPPAADGEAAGFFGRCRRCGKEDHKTVALPHPVHWAP